LPVGMLNQTITEFVYQPGHVKRQNEHRHPEFEFYKEYPGRPRLAVAFSVN
jgi:hypothetical protein